MKSVLFGVTAILLAVTSSATAADIPKYVRDAIANVDRGSDQTKSDANRKPAEMATFAGVKPGDTVVDLVPGRGYFTTIFSNIAGAKGHVYAFWPSEMDPLFAKFNIEVPKDGANLPSLSNASVVHKALVSFSTPTKPDVIWTSQNYHDFHNNMGAGFDIAAMNTAIFNALKPGGVFIVLDHVGTPASGLAETDTKHRIDPEVVKKEVTAAGFVFEGESDALRNPADDHSKGVFDPSIRGKTDQFVYKFRKPK